MSEGLEAFRRIVCHSLDEDYSWSKELENDENIVEKELEALEIIKEYMSVKEDENGLYWLMCLGGGIGISKDKYDLLKEVLL